VNYLAHLFLSDPDLEALIGNLVADCVKGPAVLTLPPGIQRGIRQHRQVDLFTDRHPVVQRSITRISAEWGWFSGILIDIWFDHVLAGTWERWSTEPLRSFVDRMHVVCANEVEHLPFEGRDLIERLIETDRLYSYLTVEGITEALTRFSAFIRHRFPKKRIHLDEAVPDLLHHQEGLKEDFLEFFPTLIGHVRSSGESITPSNRP